MTSTIDVCLEVCLELFSDSPSSNNNKNKRDYKTCKAVCYITFACFCFLLLFYIVFASALDDGQNELNLIRQKQQVEQAKLLRASIINHDDSFRQGLKGQTASDLVSRICASRKERREEEEGHGTEKENGGGAPDSYQQRIIFNKRQQGKKKKARRTEEEARADYYCDFINQKEDSKKHREQEAEKLLHAPATSLHSDLLPDELPAKELSSIGLHWADHRPAQDLEPQKVKDAALGEFKGATMNLAEHVNAGRVHERPIIHKILDRHDRRSLIAIVNSFTQVPGENHLPVPQRHYSPLTQVNKNSAPFSPSKKITLPPSLQYVPGDPRQAKIINDNNKAADDKNKKKKKDYAAIVAAEKAKEHHKQQHSSHHHNKDDKNKKKDKHKNNKNNKVH